MHLGKAMRGWRRVSWWVSLSINGLSFSLRLAAYNITKVPATLRSGDAQCGTRYVCTIANGLAELRTWKGSNSAKPDGLPQPEFCPGALRNPGTRDDRIVFRRGH